MLHAFYVWGDHGRFYVRCILFHPHLKDAHPNVKSWSRATIQLFEDVWLTSCCCRWFACEQRWGGQALRCARLGSFLALNNLLYDSPILPHLRPIVTRVPRFSWGVSGGLHPSPTLCNSNNIFEFWVNSNSSVSILNNISRSAATCAKHVRDGPPVWWGTLRNTTQYTLPYACTCTTLHSVQTL
jgi:hypothetical protein